MPQAKGIKLLRLGMIARRPNWQLILGQKDKLPASAFVMLVKIREMSKKKIHCRRKDSGIHMVSGIPWYCKKGENCTVAKLCRQRTAMFRHIIYRSLS